MKIVKNTVIVLATVCVAFLIWSFIKINIWNLAMSQADQACQNVINTAIKNGTLLLPESK